MKLWILAFSACLLGSTVSLAEWKEHKITYDVVAENSDDVTMALLVFQPLANFYLNSELAGEKKRTVLKVEGTITIYRWSDDANCTALTMPEDFSAMEVSSTDSTCGVSMASVFPEPCSTSPAKAAPFTFKKKNCG